MTTTLSALHAPPTTKTTIFDIDGLTVSYGKSVAVRDVTRARE